MRRRIAATARRMRARTRLWLWRHPRARALLARSGGLAVDESALARGVAVGLLIGLTPTVGIQTPLLFGGALLFRANFPAAFIASWINNPLTVAPLYFGVFTLGEYLEQLLPVGFADLFAGAGREVVMQMTGVLLASLTIAVPAALFGYLLFLLVWRRLAR
jgi:uncharacterized protein (DUF2062 family)